MAAWQEFTGLNSGYVLELYDKYRRDPASVDAETRAIFDQWTPPAEVSAIESGGAIPYQTIVGATSLAQSIRRYGHLAARLDPLGLRIPVGDPSLLPETNGVTEDDLRRLPANLIAALRAIYCSTTGYDYAHVFVPEERHWLRNAAEGGRFRAPSDPIDPGAL